MAEFACFRAEEPEVVHCLVSIDAEFPLTAISAFEDSM